MRAYLKNYRQSPRKVRLSANLVTGKSVSRACLLLDSVCKRASAPLKKLIDSAVANAKHNDKKEKGGLFIKEFRVDGGVTMKRYRPRARGSAHPIRKRTSNITVVLEER